MKLELRKIRLIGSFLLGSMILTSCLDGDDGVQIPENYGFVSFFNVSPDSNGLKFYSNDVLLNSNPVSYSQFSNYILFEEGNNTFTVNSGAGSNLDTLSMNIEKNKIYSLFATNEFENLELTVYEDVLFTPSSGKALMRFIQLSPDAPQLIVSLEGETTPIGNFSYKQSTSFIEINEAVNKDMYLIDAVTEDTLLTKEMDFVNGKVYSIFSKGFVNTTDENQVLDIQVVPINL